MTIETIKPNKRIPPSLTIARYLHPFASSKSVHLVGPLLDGENHFRDPVIFVDGGVYFRQGREGLSVGDGDSSEPPLDEQLNPNKNYSDLAYVLASLPHHFSEVMLHGFLGGRRDHEWINLGEAHAFLLNRHQATALHFDDKVNGFSAGEWQLKINQPFSLICLEAAQIKLEGDCEYPLKKTTRIEPLSSFGLSNNGEGDVILHSDKPTFIIYNDQS